MGGFDTQAEPPGRATPWVAGAAMIPVARQPPMGWRYPACPVAAIQLRAALSTTLPGANCSSM
jgi:hypothetical protein